MPSTTQPSKAARALTFLKRLIVTVVVLALAGVTVFLLSERNARTFTLEAHDGKLVVLKGRMLPTGADPWTPADATLADAYAPLALEGTSPLGAIGTTYDDRDGLDRALFAVIEPMALAKVASDDPKELEKGAYLVRRGELLSGLTDEQKLSLKKMKAEVSLYTARLELIDGQKRIEEALAGLKLAAAAEGRHGQMANQMILAVEPEAKALVEAVRRASAMAAPAGKAAAIGTVPTGSPVPQAAPSQGVPSGAPPVEVPSP